MKNYLTALLAFFILITFSLSAQYAKIPLDFEDSYIGENQPLPAEQELLFSGTIPTSVDLVEIRIFSYRGKNKQTPLHSASWKRPLNNNAASYALPVNYKLRSSSRYDIEALYFSPLSSRERLDLLNRIEQRMLLYLQSQKEQKERDIAWEEKPRHLRKGLNEILKTELELYRFPIEPPRHSLSELVELQMENMQSLSLPKDSTQAAKRMEEEMEALRKAMRQELEFLIPERSVVLVDSRYIEDAPTEQKRGALSINVGYGGVYMDGEFDRDFSYDTSPYVGLSFPLGNSAFAAKFFSNTYLGFGIFIDKLEDVDGTELSGPIVGRPIYASLDYKLFQFVYFNAGATLLERQAEQNGSYGLLIRPWIGLSAKVNLAISLDR